MNETYSTKLNNTNLIKITWKQEDSTRIFRKRLHPPMLRMPIFLTQIINSSHIFLTGCILSDYLILKKNVKIGFQISYKKELMLVMIATMPIIHIFDRKNEKSFLFRYMIFEHSHLKHSKTFFFFEMQMFTYPSFTLFHL